MAKNSGKIFEESFKKSVPDYCMLQRLNDPPQSFGGGTARFSLQNPCDYLMFDSQRKILIPIELKTTKYKSMSFENIDVQEQSRGMIHKHQIIGLSKFSSYDNVLPGFLLNFRDEKNNEERTYFHFINDFLQMIKSTEKKSINEIDILFYNAVKVNGCKKRTRYIWDIDELLEKIYSKYIKV